MKDSTCIEALLSFRSAASVVPQQQAGLVLLCTELKIYPSVAIVAASIVVVLLLLFLRCYVVASVVTVVVVALPSLLLRRH